MNNFPHAYKRPNYLRSDKGTLWMCVILLPVLLLAAKLLGA